MKPLTKLKQVLLNTLPGTPHIPYRINPREQCPKCIINDLGQCAIGLLCFHIIMRVRSLLIHDVVYLYFEMKTETDSKRKYAMLKKRFLICTTPFL